MQVPLTPSVGGNTPEARGFSQTYPLRRPPQRCLRQTWHCLLPGASALLFWISSRICNQAWRASCTETFILDGADIARVVIEDDRLEHPTHDLAAARLGQHADEVHVADDRQRAQIAAYRVEQGCLSSSDG